MSIFRKLIYGVITAYAVLTTPLYAATVPTLPSAANVVAPTYFMVRPDFRKCVAPMCGGWWVKAVNLPRMRCLDGRFAQECYVGASRVSIPNLSDAQNAELQLAMSASKALLQAKLVNDVSYGTLDIARAWLGATDVPPTDIFLNVKDNGIRCITYPCLNLDAEVLNRGVIKSLADLDLSAVGASDKQLLAAQQALSSGEGLSVSGKYTQVTGPAGTAQAFVASQFYLPLIGEMIAFCRPTGCSGQLCAGTDVTTTCEWRPEYACYATAQCSTQSNGDCGWVMDDALRQCLAKAATSALLKLNPAK